MPWIYGNRYLSIDEMKNNADIIYQTLTQYGWTIESISAILGNMQTESTINPGIWENRTTTPDPSVDGYGLTQWTPAQKYIDFAGENWENNGNKQLDKIQNEVDTGGQWFANPSATIIIPPISFYEFTQDTRDVGTLADYFLWYYEHPSVTIQPIRAEQAKLWYEYLGGKPIKKKKGMPVYMMLKQNKRRCKKWRY